MSRLLTAGASALAIAALSATSAFAQSDPEPATAPAASEPWVDVITVTGRVLGADLSVDPAAAPAAAPDAAGLIARLPGADLIDNGALSGQVQYRGLFGPRIAVAVDGQRFASGGPNLMDPPLHYAPAPLIERVELTRGPAPVSAGPGLSARANAVFKSVDFAEGDAPVLSADLTGIARSVDESYAAGGVAGFATRRQRVELLLSEEQGGDISTPLGDLNGTEHERTVFGLGYGAKLTDGIELSLEARRQETDFTGNPPFPMDIRFFDSRFTRGGLTAEAGSWSLAFSLAHARVDHGMNNFDLRPAPAMMRLRETLASSETWTAEVAADRALGAGVLSIGADLEDAEHDVTITNPANAGFFVTPFPDISLQRAGAFSQWEGPAGPVEAYIGARVDAYSAEAGVPTLGPVLPMGPRMLAGAFAASDRSWDEVTLDALTRISYQAAPGLRLRAALSRKNRAPGYLERFGWLPIPASGGLADGNTYVGDLDLDVETATAGEIGFDWSGDVSGRATYVRATAHLTHIEDYIQGTPAEPATPGVVDTPLEMVSAMNGDPTPLRFSNVEARLYGLDADFGLDLPGAWRADGVASLIRGERRDVDDDLYRIAPSNLRLSLSYEAQSWLAGLEALAVAEQDHVSAENGETPTPGYVVLNAFARAELGEAARVSVGAQNLLDQRYREHLAGFNRNVGLGLPVGARLPGPGIGLWLRLDTTF